MRFLPLMILISLMILSSCGEANKKKDSGIEHPEGLVFPINVTKGGTYTSMEQLRNQILSLINHRIEQNPKSLSMITHGVYEPEFVFDGSKMSKQYQYKGFWIDFKDDFTYEYGYFDNTQGSGRYYLSLEDDTLMAVDDDPSIEAKIWTVAHNGEAMAISGRHDFGVNNGTQIKMLPSDFKPTRPQKK